MPRFSANLSMLFTEVPFLDRFSLARDAGFDTVEFQFPYDVDASEIRSRLLTYDLDLALFNLPAGDWDAGDRGIAADYSRIDEFRRGLENACDYARILRPAAINLLAGASEDTPENDLALLRNIRIAAEAFEDDDVTLLLEPVNTVNVPHFALPTSLAALDLIDEFENPRIKLQLDIYHCTRMGEDPIQIITQNAESIGHIQIADVPGRLQPGSGTIDWPRIYAAIDESGYTGRVGLEFVPEPDTNAALISMREAGLLQ